jgi:hypothetical protein
MINWQTDAWQSLDHQLAVTINYSEVSATPNPTGHGIFTRM